MATEQDGLQKRAPGASTLSTLFNPAASDRDRLVAGGKAAGVVGGVAGVGIFGVDAIVTHAAGPIGSLIMANEPVVITAIAAGGLATVATTLLRAVEKSDTRKGDSTHTKYAEQNRNGNRAFYRTVGGVAVVVSGAAALAAGGLDVTHAILGGGHGMVDAASTALQVAEASLVVGGVGLGAGRYWNRRVEGAQKALGE